MKSIFKIYDSFKITRRGLVIVGDILEGEISIGDKIKFKHEGKIKEMEISGIESVDKIALKISHIGLILKYENDIEKDYFSELKIEQQLAEINKK